MTYKPGQSGNPRGRPKGTSPAAKLSKAIEQDLSGIIAAMVDSAKTGDTSAAKLLLDRVIPALKPLQQPVRINGLSGKTLSNQGSAIITAMGAGNLSSEQAQDMLSSLVRLSKLIEIDEIERRLSALEEQRGYN